MFALYNKFDNSEHFCLKFDTFLSIFALYNEFNTIQNIFTLSWQNFGWHLLQIFLFVPRSPKNEPKIAEKLQNFERKFKFRSFKSYFFKMYGWI